MKIKYALALTLALLLALLADPVSAGDASTPRTMGDLLGAGGPLMYVLYALSFLSVCLIFYYFLTLRKDVIVPGSLVKEFEEKKKDLEIMGRICAEDDSPLAKIVGAGVETLRKQNSTYAMVKDAVEDEGSRQGGILWQRIQYLQDIVVIAPMVGLLGTVQGMIQSFGALYAENMTPKPTLIAHGVAMALITTAAGLVIGIFSMMVYSYFRGRVNHLISELEGASSRISRELIRLSKPEETGEGGK